MLVGLGSNQSSRAGTPTETLCHALGVLTRYDVQVEAVSALFKTPAVPAGSGPDYVNAVARFRFDGTPQLALALLKRVEDDLGRKKSQRWGPRALDLDLLAFGSQVVPDCPTVAYWQDLPLDRQKTEVPADLILPHPRIQDRAFVLVPLAEIAPDWRHPLLGKTVREMRDNLPVADRAAVTRLPRCAGWPG